MERAAIFALLLWRVERARVAANNHPADLEHQALLSFFAQRFSPARCRGPFLKRTASDQQHAHLACLRLKYLRVESIEREGELHAITSLLKNCSGWKNFLFRKDAHSVIRL